MTAYLRIWRAFFANSLARAMQFRANFVLNIVTSLAWNISNILFFDVIYRHVADIGDWTRNEVMILLGTYYIIDALNVCLFTNNVFSLPRYVNQGELDFMLLKPINPQFLVSTRYVAWSQFFALFGGIAVVVWGLSGLDVTPSVIDVALYVVLLICGLLIVYATCFIYQCMSFWLVASQGWENGYWMFEAFIMKPDSIYRGVVSFLLTFVFPATVIACVPARALLDKALAPEMIAWTVGVTALLLWLSHVCFKRGLQRYESASS